MIKEVIYKKETVLTYLINELSNKCNYKVSTVLTPDGCWTGEIRIQETLNQNVEDENYYLAIAENIKKVLTNDSKYVIINTQQEEMR